MRYVKAIILIWMAMSVIFAMTITAFAADIEVPSTFPDYQRKGSITVDVLSTDTGKPIAGGKLTLYKVAVATQTDGDNRFILTDLFKKSNVDINSITESDAGAEDLAFELENYINTNHIAGEAISVDSNGQAVWNDLELGAYLVINTVPAKGYEAMNAFLVTVPRYLDGVYVYDVTANPKSGTADSAASGTSEPNTSTANTSIGNTSASNTSAANTNDTNTTTKTTTSTSKKLPQTGQLWWPVPILTLAGMSSMLLGWYRRRCYGESDNEC